MAALVLGPPAFEYAEALAHDQINDEFADLWRFVPMIVKPNKSPTPDRARAAYTLLGVFEYESKMSSMGMEEIGVSSRSPQVTFRRCDFQTPMKRGDMLTRVRTKEMFEITRTEPDTYSGVTVRLVELGLQQ